jgi:hypothetical protein
MAAKKKKKAKKAAKPAKANKAPAKKSKKAAKKSAKRLPKKAKKAAVKKAPAKKASQKIKGEGDYAASRTFMKDESGFVKKNKASIPAMGKEAEAAMDGPEGAALRDAETRAAGRSRDTF